MNTKEDGAYWLRACEFFRTSGFADTPGSYFLHNKNSRAVKIGIMCQVSVSVGEEGLSRTVAGEETVVFPRSEASVFKHVEKLLSEKIPCFFVISPDFQRRYVDKKLPLIHFVQPALEFTFLPQVADGEISYARDAACEQQGAAMLRAAFDKSIASWPLASQEMTSSSQLMEGWVPAEEDSCFLQRLSDAISVLQAFPDGKMTLTRAFERKLPPKRDLFGLYEIHSGVNGEYAFSHFFCIRKDLVSLGASPENILEMRGRELTVDVVAATCKASSSREYLSKELTNNPKQTKEHKSSLDNRRNRFRPFCAEGSIRIIQEMHLKTLRNVCHLHSIFSGKLLPQTTIFDLMGVLFPLLGARPKELLANADTEEEPHRYYGGVVGHLHDESGGCFLNIRNALLLGEKIYAKVGVGLLKESIPEFELVETRDKMAGLLEAIHLWERSCLVQERT